MKLLNFTIIKLTLALIIGIGFGQYFMVERHTSVLLCTSFLFVFAASYFHAKYRQQRRSAIFNSVALCTMVGIGLQL